MKIASPTRLANFVRRAKQNRLTTAQKKKPIRRRRLFGEVLEDRTLMTFDFQSAFALSGGGIFPEAVAVSPDGNSYIAGIFAGSQNFDPNGSAAGKLTTGTGDTADGVFLAKYTSSGAFVWARQMNATWSSDQQTPVVTALAVDPNSGSVYAVGMLDGQLGFSGVGSSVVLNPGLSAGFVAKFTPSGTIDSGQVLQLGGIVGGTPGGSYALSNEVIPTGIAVDSTGQHVVITGSYFGSGDGETVDIYPGVGPAGGVSSPAYGSDDSPSRDTFVLTLTSSFGFVAPPDRLGFSNGGGRSSVAVAANGDIFVAGGIGSGLFGEIPFVAKLNINDPGQRIGPYSFNGDSNFSFAGIAVDSEGNAYVTGSFFGTDVFHTTGLKTATLVSAGADNMFIVKVDPSLNLTWAERIGSSGSDFAIGLAIDGSNHLYLAANLAGSATYNQTGQPTPIAPATNRDAGQSGVTVLKLDTGGTPTDILAAGGGAQLVLLSISLGTNNALATNPSGQVAMAGLYTGNLDFSGTKLPTSASTSGSITGDTLANMALVRLGDVSAAPPAPLFVGESRVIVALGSGKHRHGKKVTYYQLNFTAPLNIQAVAMTSLYEVTQVKKGHGKKHPNKTINVQVTSAVAGSDGKSVRLALGKFQKKLGLSLTAPDLPAANGTSVPLFTTTL